MSEHQRQSGDRRHLSMTEVVSIFMLVLQLAALVWGAATLNASVRQVAVALAETRVDVRDTNRKVDELAIDVAVLKAEKLKEVRAR